MAVADVGAEIGYFTLYLSERVGKTGKIYASDIDENALAFLDKRLKAAARDNIVIIHGEPDDPMIPKASVDIVLVVNTIHLVKEKTAFLNNLRESLREKGKLVFVQWNAEKMDPEAPGWDPQDRELYTKRTMLKMIDDAGYKVLEIKDFLPMQLIYICRPSDTSGDQSRSASRSSQDASIAAQLLGTWSLVAVSEEEDGRVIESPIYGAHPAGYLMYDSTGHVCVQLINTTRPRWKDGDVPTPEEARSAIVGFGGYCGRYEIHAEEGYVVHFPEASISPNEIGQPLKRYFTLHGDRLQLKAVERRATDGVLTTKTITWTRMK
jgi:SAM-dependent methyltransferase